MPSDAGLYVCRKLTPACAEAFTAWATEQGFANLTPPDDLHATIVYSRSPVSLGAEGGEIVIPDDGNRSIQPLGDKGAVVLRFGSVPLKERWQRAMDAGASWDHDGFHPHVTVTYDAGSKDLSTVKPFDGPLVFGPEVHAPLDEDWAVSQGLRAASDEALTDSVGRKHYDRVPISKANVCEYRGEEIPNWEGLGLDPAKLYRLLRDPAELAKAAPSFDNIQLLYRHVPVSADDHRPDDIVGTTGTKAEFEHPYLYNALSVWAQHAIDGIDDKSRHELSSSYSYTADMTPGAFEGQAYDGRMIDIAGNHVAVIPKGRVGPDVALDEAPKAALEALGMDSALIENPDVPKEIEMSKKALSSRTAVRLGAALSALAMDSKFDPAPITLGVTARNFKSRKASIAKSVRVAMDALEEQPAAMSGGATPDDVIMRMLDLVDAQTSAEPIEADEDPMATNTSAAPAPAAAESGGQMDKAKIMEWLKSKGMGEDDMSELNGLMGDPAEDEETDEEKAARLKKAEDDMNKEPMVTKTAMDAALTAVRDTVLKTQREITAATAYVRPWVGELAMDESISCATDVYRKALGSLNVSGAATMHPEALKAVLDVQAKPGDRKVREPALAMDAATADSFAKMFPGAMRIGLNH